jgi:hypothetical protein
MQLCRRGLHHCLPALMLSTCAQVINAGQAKPSPPVGPALGQVSKRRRQRDLLPQQW